MRRITMKEVIARDGDITKKVWFKTPRRKPPARPEHVWRVLNDADHPMTIDEIVYALYGVTVSPNHDPEVNRTRQQLYRLKCRGILDSQISTTGLAIYWIKGRF